MASSSTTNLTEIHEEILERIDRFVSARMNDQQFRDMFRKEVESRVVRYCFTEKDPNPERPKILKTASGPLTTTQGNVLNVYMSRIYGYYNTAFLKVMANLEKIVISYSHLDPREFIDAAIDHIELKELHMVGCGQFSEFQMIELFCCLPNLEVIDATCTCGILYVSAYVICCNLRKLKMLKVEPKFPFEERFDWAKLQAIFHHINFGKKVYAVVRCAHS